MGLTIPVHEYPALETECWTVTVSAVTKGWRRLIVCTPVVVSMRDFPHGLDDDMRRTIVEELKTTIRQKAEAKSDQVKSFGEYWYQLDTKAGK